MKIRLMPVMALVLSSIGVRAQAPSIGAVIDGLEYNFDDAIGTKYLSVDSPQGYHLSGSFAFTGTSLSYDIILNGGPTTTGNVVLWLTAPHSWYEGLPSWCNNASSRFYGIPVGGLTGKVTLGVSHGTGAELGDPWHFSNEFGGQDTFEQRIPFSPPPEQTMSVNLCVDKPIGLTVEARGWSGLSLTPEPSSVVTILGAVCAGMLSRRAARRARRSSRAVSAS